MNRVYVIQWKENGYTNQYVADTIDEAQRIIGSFLESDEDKKLMFDYIIKTMPLKDYTRGE